MKRSFLSLIKTPFFRVTSFVMGAVFAAGLVTMFAVKALDQIGVFELEGNSLRNTPASSLPDDWEDVFLFTTDGAAATVFIPISEEGDSGVVLEGETDPVDADVSYAGTDTKDVIDIGMWNLQAGDIAPDKDEITNAFAAAYVAKADFCYDPDDNADIPCVPVADGAEDPNHYVAKTGDLLIAFGLDRFATNGDSQVGFWFLEDSLFDSEGNFTGFSGTSHSLNDVLVLSDFVNGGRVSDVDAFRWVGSGGSDNELDQLGEGADCKDTPHDNPHLCATVSEDEDNTTDPIWDYVHKKIKGQGVFKYQPGSFYEGMINMTQLGITGNCISSFIAETRSSHSTTAELKDLALGRFDICSIEVTKEATPLSKLGDEEVVYEITIKNTGALELFKQSITDTLLGDITDDAVADCDSLMPDEECTFFVSRAVMEGDDDPLPNTVTAIYDSASSLDGDEVTDSDDAETNLFQPDVDIDKTADSVLNKAGDTVHYTITVTNLSSDDTPTMDCTVTDTLTDLGEDGDVELTSGAVETIEYDFEIPAGTEEDTVDNTATVVCTPQGGFTNTVEDEDGHSVDLFYPGIELVKESDIDLSKAGDTVNYTITVNNTSDADTPELTCNITDELLEIDEEVMLGFGGSHVINKAFEVPAGEDFDPLNNTASVTCAIEGFENTVSDDDSAEVEIFQPDLEIVKECPEGTWYVGQERELLFTITNTSSPDTPNLQRVSVTDAKLGGDIASHAPAELVSGDSVQFSIAYTPDADDIPSFTNEVTAVYSPDGFPNQISADDSVDCEVSKRPSELVTFIHADDDEILGNGNDHNNVPFGSSLPAFLTYVHDLGEVSDASGLGSLLTPTGSIEFQIFQNAACTEPAFTGTIPTREGSDDYSSGALSVTVSAGAAGTATAETGSFRLPTSGVSWLATYSGDANFESAVYGVCENVNASALDTETVTFIHEGEPNTGHDESTEDLQLPHDPIPVGTTIHDMARVTGPEGAPTPEGTVDFLLYSSHADCQEGAVVPIFDTGTLGAGGYAPGFAESMSHFIDSFGTGELAFQAVYTPADADLYNPSTGACELLDLVKNPSTITTEVHDSGHTVITFDVFGEVSVGTLIHDWAQVVGGGKAGEVDIAPSSPAPVVFTLYSGLDCLADNELMTFERALVEGATNSSEAETLPHELLATSGDEWSFTASWAGDDVYFAAEDIRGCEPVAVEIVGDEGCTPGYWKQEHHFGNWVGYSPSDSYADVFGVSPTLDVNLLEALGAGGGGEQALWRHSVAALLNAASDTVEGGVEFGVSEAEVIALVQEAYDTGDFEGIKNQLAELNERGCPLARAELNGD